MSETEVSSNPAADAWLDGNMEKAQQLNRPIDVQPQGRLPQDDTPMPPAPTEEATIVARAATTLTELGPEGAALVRAWGGPSSHDFQENLAYAKTAFKDIATNRPDLIEKFDASGLGSDPSVLEFLAKHGRLSAGFSGENTVSHRYSSEPSRPAPRGMSAAQNELKALYRDNPPGSPEYKNPQVQRRIAQLSEIVSGGGSPVGTNGRTA